MFGREVRSVASALDEMPLDELNRWNQAILPLQGIGEDCFFLNECFAKGTSLLDFETLLDYDEHDYRFQEKMRKKEFPGYESRPYRGSFHSGWARLFDGDRFTYATLSMPAAYIDSDLQGLTFDVIKECIPHRYVPGRDHGKRIGDSYQWDMRVDADGQEALLKELDRQTMQYVSERHDVLQSEWDGYGKHSVYLIDASTPEEFHIHFVFTDTKALGAVRFRSFLRDCRAIERSADELTQALSQETARLADFIRGKHQELTRMFDPAVARLRKKRKVLMHKDVFDDLG